MPVLPVKLKEDANRPWRALKVDPSLPQVSTGKALFSRLPLPETKRFFIDFKVVRSA